MSEPRTESLMFITHHFIGEGPSREKITADARKGSHLHNVLFDAATLAVKKLAIVDVWFNGALYRIDPWKVLDLLERMAVPS